MADWIEVLRAAAAASSQSEVAGRIGYSTAVVNQVLKGTYKGDMKRVERAVQGALMGATVNCPEIGEIPRQRCVEHQRAPFRITNPTAVRIYKACRSGCPNSLIKSGDAGKENAS